MFAKIEEILYPKAFPAQPDAALLVLRVGVALTFFLKHGLDKLAHFSQLPQQFSDPLHLGVAPTFVLVWFCDVVCSVLVMLGVATRWAAACIFLNVLVAWIYFGQYSFWLKSATRYSELQVVYLGAWLAIVVLGAGKFSLDWMLANKSERP